MAGVVAWRLFTQGGIEAGSKEITRDFGIDVDKKGVQAILDSLGITEDQFYDVRKELLSAPRIMEEFLIPAAKAQGKLDELIKRFSVFETSWGTFDLSGPLRDAIATGDFTAYNEAWAKIFADSDRLINLFGEDYPLALGATSEALRLAAFDVDMLVASLGLSGDAAQAAKDALTTGSTTTTTTTQEAIPIEELFPDIDPRFLEHLGDIDTGYRNITTTTTTLTFATLAQADAFSKGALAMRDYIGVGGVEGATKAMEALEYSISGANVEFINQGITMGQQEKLWAVFGDDIKRMVEIYQDLGLEVPPAIQALYDWGIAADEATAATERLEAITKSGREAMEEYLGAGVTQVTQDMGDLVLAMDAGSIAFLASGSAIDQTQAMWDVFGKDIIAVVEAAQALGIAIPPEIQRIYDWGMAADEAKNKTAALRREWGSVASDLPGYMNNIARGFAGLGADLKNLTDEELTNVIEGFDQMWNVAAGDRSSMSTLQSIAGGGTIFSNLFQRTERLIGQGIDEARHQIDILGRSVLEAQTSFWTAYGNQITNLFNQFQAHGVEMSKIPADIRQMIDFALRNDLLDANDLDIANNPEIAALKEQIKFFEDEGRGRSEKAMAVREELRLLLAGLVYDPNAPGQSLAQLMEAGNLGASGVEESQDAFDQVKQGMTDMGVTATDTVGIVTAGLIEIQTELIGVAREAREAGAAMASMDRPSSMPTPTETETTTGLSLEDQRRLENMNRFRGLFGAQPLTSLPGAAMGGYVKEGGAVIVHKGENIIPAEQSKGGDTYVLNIEGPVYGFDDFEDRVSEAWMRQVRSGGFRKTSKFLN